MSSLGYATGERVRVAVVTTRLDIGGTERHLSRILPELRQRGIDVSVFVLQRGGRLEADILAAGIRIEGPRKASLPSGQTIAALIGLVRFLRDERPTLVHFFLPRPYIVGSIAAELVGHRHRIMSRRSLATYRRGTLAWFKWVEIMLHRRTRVLLGNSTAVVAELCAEAKEPSTVGLIHNGMSLPSEVLEQERAVLRNDLKIDLDTCVIAVVANLIPYKGHADLLDALARIKDDLPGSWRLLVIGRDDGIGAELRERANALGISEHILWLGEQADIDRYMRGIDIAVLPSHEEGFSNALLEAMAYGVAPVATRVGGNADAIVDEECGLLVPPHNPAALAAAILRLAADEGLRRLLGQAGRSRIERLFSHQACVEKYEKLYRGLSEFRAGPVDDIIDGHAA